ncbi:integrase, catalytic region, zinc finger, CCHC-type containing protein [Tanacetum coccineum]
MAELQQFEKLVNASRAKKLEKSHDPLALVAHTGSSSRTTSSYYVTHPSSVVDYDDDYQGDAVQNTFEDPLTSAMILLARAITQRTAANVQCYNCNEKGHYAEGDDLHTGARESNLYTISNSDMAASSPVCLLSKATSTKSWLWHRRLSHLNFGTVNDLTKNNLVDGLPKFNTVKITFYKIRTDNGTEFKNAILKAHYEKLGIMQQFLTARTPQQNGVVERRNCTLIEVARTKVIFSRLPEFLWAKAISTACFTQNRSIIHTRYNKTPYELLHGRKPNVEYFHVFGSLCYSTNDREDLGKMKPKADIGIFIGYSKTSRGLPKRL